MDMRDSIRRRQAGELPRTLTAFAAALLVSFAIAARAGVYPQSFDAGGRSLGVQFMDVMGSP